MADLTPEEREAQLARDRRSRTPNSDYRPNPAFGTSPFDPNAQLSVVPTDPKLAEPLPQGRYIDPRIPSQIALSRAEDIKALRENPAAYVQEHAAELNNEQSLMDRGKTMLARVFDYQDDADMQLFGVNLSAVESVWDTSIRYLTGAYDLLNVGFGGLISAMPGGLRTLSYDELSGGKDVGQVLSGEMEPGSAPSPGQIAVASVAVEAKRIREGKVRMSDILLANPATAPFILAGVAAKTSPLQQEGFDIMDKEQRERAFGAGWEQWMSGITDAGLMFADPLIGAGVVAKTIRAGKLAARGPVKYAAEFAATSNDDLDRLTTRLGDLRTPDQYYAEVLQRQPDMLPGTTLKEVKETGNVRPPEWSVPQIYDDVPLPTAKEVGILGEVYARVAQRSRATGEKVMSQAEIERMPELQSTPQRGYIAGLLHDARDVYEVALVFEAMNGTGQSMRRLGAMAPALADQVLSLRRIQLAELRAATEPGKINEASEYLARATENLESEIAALDKQVGFLGERMARIAPDANLRGAQLLDAGDYTRLKQQRETLERSLEEARGLYRIIKDGEMPDIMDQRSPWFKADEADRILDDLHARQQWAGRLNEAVFDAAAGARFTMPTRNNMYSRAVRRSRDRRGTAAYQYSVEKTSLLPRRRLVESSATGQRYEWDFWSQSQFEGVSRLQRNARVWRWLGTETPSGYIGLKGTASVGAEREFSAALDLDLYKNEPVQVTVMRDVTTTGKDGKSITVQQPEVVQVGGRAAREEYFRTFYAALNDPGADSMKALMDVEEKVMDDLALAYGYHSTTARDGFKDMLKLANRNRAADLDRLRATGTVVDGDTTHYVPYLETHLANGTFMQNFQQLERFLKKNSLDSRLSRGTAAVEKAFEVPAHMAGSAYELFNNLWRPATLLRLSYTQRNVFEGMVRAMAYSASLAPLSWPVRATYNGTRNAIVKRAVAQRVKAANKAINESEFGEIWREYTAAGDEFYRLQTAIETGDEGAKVFKMAVKEPGEPTRIVEMTQDEYTRLVNNAAQRRGNAEDALRSSGAQQKFADAVKGTEFGKWRQKQLDALSQSIMERAHMENAILDNLAAVKAAGMEIDPWSDPEILEYFGTQAGLQLLDLRKQDMLMHNPLAALHEYTGLAGRQKRIGSGMSMGPDGNMYGNAFDGPLEQINRGLMSADNTVKQTLSGSSNVFGNPFYRILVRDNPVIQYSDQNMDAWATGLAQAIEDASSSRVVRMLMDNVSDDFTEFNIDKVVDWMVSADPEARTFTTRLMSMMGGDALNPVSLEDVARTDPAMLAMVDKEKGRLRRFAQDVPTASGGSARVFDRGGVETYVRGVSEILSQQMQGNREFFNLLNKRLTQKAAKAEGPGITGQDVKRILEAMDPEQRRNLSYIQGSETIQMGMSGPMEIWTKAMSSMFRALGTIPEDAVTRGPFYNMRYKETRNALIEKYWVEEMGMDIKDVRARNKARTKSGRAEGGSVSHPEFEIPAKRLSEIEVTAHRRALMDTREWMYTIERRTKLGKYGEWLYPFISATQNTATVTGKLLWKEPWLAPMIADVWRAPQRLGVEDEDGNIVMPMPMEWVRDTLQNHPGIPFLGGAVDSADSIKIPKNGLNVWMPETGFGLVPTPHAWVQVGASELMKAGAFPVETPGPFKALFGSQENADEAYQALKDYIFGEGSGMSDRMASWDLVFPASLQKIINMKDTLSAQYGYQYAMQWHTQTMRARAGERPDMPTEAEIHKRTTNMFWFQFFGNIGLPTPLTPYPILTRPQVEQSPVKALQDVYGKMRSVDPMNASMNMERMFGDWGLAAALTKITMSPGGASPTAATVSDINTLQPLIRKIAPTLGDNTQVLGMLVNNRSSRADYDISAYQWQKTQSIPGRGETWRAIQPPEMSEQERQRVVGWTVYRRFFDQLDARLQNAGFESYEVKGAAEFKAAKETFIDMMLNNPDYGGWAIDYQDMGGNRTGAAVRTLEMSLRDPQFTSFMVQSGKERTLSAMVDYLNYRQMLVDVLQASGHGIEHDDNILLKLSWAKIRQDLRNRDERWAEIDDLYFSNDDDPKPVGAIVDPNAPLMGAGNG